MVNGRRLPASDISREIKPSEPIDFTAARVSPRGTLVLPVGLFVPMIMNMKRRQIGLQQLPLFR